MEAPHQQQLDPQPVPQQPGLQQQLRQLLSQIQAFQRQQQQNPVPQQRAALPPQENRMQLTDQEHLIAKLIKAAIAIKPEVEPLSDFMYGQFAIVALLQGETNAANIVEKIVNLQAVREEHLISDTYEQGQNMLSRMVLDVTPGFHLCFTYCPQESAYVSVTDYTKFPSGVLGNEEKTHIWMAGEYYRKHASYPDFEAIRRGIITLIECEGYDWKSPSMMNMIGFRKIASELGSNYPIHFRSVKHYHTGMFLNLLVSTGRRLLPKLIHKSFEVGCQFEAGRLDEVFLIPNAETANERLVASLQESLKKRYENEASFALD